jgi:TonB family protein
MGRPIGIPTILAIALVSLTVLCVGPSRADDSSYDPPTVDRSKPTPAPVYPPGAQMRAERGTTTIALRISSGGKPVRAVVKSSSGFEDLDKAAVEAAMGWHYLPAMRDGETVSDWVTIDIKFELPTIIQVPAPNKTQKDATDIACRNDIAITGTHIPTEVGGCLTRREWERNLQEAQQNTNEIGRKVLQKNQ